MPRLLGQKREDGDANVAPLTAAASATASSTVTTWAEATWAEATWAETTWAEATWAETSRTKSSGTEGGSIERFAPITRAWPAWAETRAETGAKPRAEAPGTKAPAPAAAESAAPEHISVLIDALFATTF